MDTSRFKRRETQTRRPLTTTTPGFSEVVPGAGVAHPKNVVPTISQPRRPLKIAVEHASDSQPESGHSTSPIDMGLPGGPSEFKRSQSAVGPSTAVKVRRWSVRSVAVVMVLLIAVGGFLFSQGFMNAHKVFKGGATTAASLTTNVNPNLLKGEGDGRINILLLGRGGGTHDAPDLTDTLLLASIDPVNHTATLLSIPRDLWVDVPNQGAMKINAAWETGEFRYLGKVSPGSTNQQAIQAGFSEIDQTVESVLGVPINYNMLVDFKAFKQAVDTVSGVTITVPTDLIDPTMAWENNHNPVLAKAGTQIFDGKHALIYARSRETTSDFARTERQRSLIVALKSKVINLGTLSNPIKIAGLMSTFGNNVQTDLSLNDASRLYSIVKSIDDTKVTSVSFSDDKNHFVTTGTMNKQSIVLPTAGLFNYSAIQQFVRGQLKDGYIVKENATVLVLNGTTTPGVATKVADQLKAYGYNVVGAANASTSDWDQTTLIDLSKDKYKYTAHYLEQRFNLNATTSLPSTSIQPNGADFVIIIGSDEASTPKI